MEIFRLHRSGDIEAEAQTYSNISETFASAIAPREVATLLAVRGESQVRTYLLGSREASGHLAHGVGAEAESSDFNIDDLSCAAFGRLEAKLRQPRMARSVQMGVDPAELSRALGRALPPESFVAVTLRHPSSFERSRQLRWVQHRLQSGAPTHASLTQRAMVASIAAGTGSRRETAALLSQVAGAIAGFDYDTRVVQNSLLTPALYGTVLGVALSAVGLVLGLPAWALWLVFGGCAVGGLGLGVYRRSHSGLSGVRVWSEITARPPRLLLPPRAPREASEGQRSFDGHYPLHRLSFMLAPYQVTGLVALQAGAASGETSTKTRHVPEVFTQDIGALIGRGGSDALVHIDAAEGYSGLVALGEPSSGKTVLLRTLYAWNLLEKVAPRGLPGFPGRANTLIAFENKGVEGVTEYYYWGQALGDAISVIDLYDPNTVSVDLTLSASALEGDVISRANYFVEAMQYSFPDGSIQSASRKALTPLIAGGLVLERYPHITVGIEGAPQQESFIGYANLLCAAQGDELAVQLAAAVTTAALSGEFPDPDVQLASAALGSLFGTVTPSVRRNLLQAPSSKISELAKLSSWWSPTRQRMSWAQVLDSQGSWVVNLGKSGTGQAPSGELARIMSSMLMFTLKTQIEQHCGGWQLQGRTVSLFSDELSVLSGSTPEVFRWMRDQGRSYGLRLYFATQYLDQLEVNLKNTLLGFGTVLAFTQGNPKLAGDLATLFSSDGAPWAASDIINLPRYTAVMRGTVGGSKRPAFTVALDYWEDKRGEFPYAQGWA